MVVFLQCSVQGDEWARAESHWLSQGQSLGTAIHTFVCGLVLSPTEQNDVGHSKHLAQRSIWRRCVPVMDPTK